MALMALNVVGTDPDTEDALTSRYVSDSIEDGKVPTNPLYPKSLRATLMALHFDIRCGGTYSLLGTQEEQPTPFHEQ